MDEKNLTPNQKEFLKDPRATCSVWLELSMSRSGASYTTTAASIGVTRDALYKKANSTLPNNPPLLVEAILQTLVTRDLTILQEYADLFDLELVPKGTMAKIKALPNAIERPTPEDFYPLYRTRPRRPLLRAMMEEAVEK